MAGYGFHRCTSGRDGAVERSDSGVVHIGTWRDTLRELHYVPEVSLSGAISVQFKAVRNWVSSFLLLRFASNANLKLIVTLSLSFSRASGCLLLLLTSSLVSFFYTLIGSELWFHVRSLELVLWHMIEKRCKTYFKIWWVVSFYSAIGKE